ncbi:PREDICTED: kinetochore-associated protein DSN1 homolog [Sturnus vulgaris]|uniref:kinetochore-associated protein DSN1 homolog n=1 Tax=Sturnus vulgaris TaxID=9172 RepID=UPI00071A207B|nr:PREDICTED: kinetochore-associated protein DSN1 homolog [Sturnus vulgaris]
MAAKPARAPRMRKALRGKAGGGKTPWRRQRREPAAPPARPLVRPRGARPGHGRTSPESGGAAPDPDSAAGAEAFLKSPDTKRSPSSSSRKKRAPSSPGPPNSFSLSPIVATPQRKRRSWRRSSLKGRRSRRKSLPPVHHDITELSKSISLELPEIQRLSLLLLSSFQVNSPKILEFTQNSGIFLVFPGVEQLLKILN